MENINKIVEEKKKHNKMMYDSKKLDICECEICKKVDRLCNSHSVPQFILKNIAKDGKVNRSGSIIKEIREIYDLNSGINNSGTFKLICSNCDKKYFNDYESSDAIKYLMEDIKNNKEALSNESKKKLVEIYLKSVLMSEYQEKVAIPYDKKKYNGKDNNEKEKAHLSDLEDLRVDLKVCLDSIDKEQYNLFIVDSIILNYKVLIAMQELVMVEYDFEGKQIFNKYILSNNKIEYLCFCVFPLEKSTLITIFGLSSAKEKYKNFKRQFKKLKQEDKLKFISAYCFAYSEQIYYNEVLEESMKKDEFFSGYANFQNIHEIKFIENESGKMKAKVIPPEVNAKDFKKINNYFARKYSMK